MTNVTKDNGKTKLTIKRYIKIDGRKIFTDKKTKKTKTESKLKNKETF